MGNHRQLRPFDKDRQPPPEKNILQDAKVTLHDLPFDLALAGDVADVQHRRVRKADGFQKAGEAPDIPDEAFHLHLLLEVEACVGPQDLLGILRGDYNG